MINLAIVAFFALALTTHADGVAGTWEMTVDTGAAHGVQTMGLTLRHEGKTIRGTFESPHGEHAVVGKFADGTLTLATEGDENMRITFSAKVKKDGTLSGYMSTPRGDMTFTARKKE